MKKSFLAPIVLGAFSSATMAQSSVTFYGLIETTIRYTTNQVKADGSTGNQLAMAEGAFQGSRIGFKGEEDLGGGMTALFKLENGFNGANGVLDQQGQLFGRQEYIGLKDRSWGEIDAGRQYGTTFDLLGKYDPLGVGNFNENDWEFFLFGGRFDNTLKYINSWGPLTAEIQYSVGGQAGSASIGSTTGGALSYNTDTFSFGGVVQQSKDANSNIMSVVGVGGSYVAGPATLELNYFEAKRDPGFAKAANNSGGALANTSILGNGGNVLQRTDDVLTASMIFQATPASRIILAYMTDSVKNESSLGDSGKTSVLYAIADYNLSKRTDVYFDLDYSKMSGGEIADTNRIFKFEGTPAGGNSSRTGAALGVRMKF